MIEIIFFVLAVFAWDALKKALRGPSVPTVKMRYINVVRAKCGCSIQDGKIVKACTAHDLLTKL